MMKLKLLSKSQLGPQICSMPRLFVVPKTVRLNRVWVPTLDTRQPLECVWVEVWKPQVEPAKANEEPGSLRLCA